MIVTKEKLDNLLKTLEVLELSYKIFCIEDMEAFLNSKIETLYPQNPKIYVNIYVIPGENIIIPTTGIHLLITQKGVYTSSIV